MKHRESGIADRESDLVRQPPSVGRPIVRAQFGSHFGVVMTFIGVAVGLGNVWRFPYMVSAFGGGAFIVVYIVILLAFGIPAIMAEFTLGRLTRRGPVGAFKSSGIPGGRGIGWILFLTVFMAVSYYSVIVGWVLKYLLISLTGSIADMHPSTFFDDLLGGFVGQLILTGAVLGLVAAVLAMGVRAGIERVSKIGMPLLFVLLVVLLVRAVTLPGAIEGLRFYLVPDFTKISPAVVAAALGQVFFSLSLGGTFLLTYSSYLPDSVDIPRSAVIMGIGETAAALLAGLVIVPAAVAFGVELTSGPPLTFITVPRIFASMPAGSVFASLFFGLLFYAAFLSAVAAYEVLVASFIDQFGLSRRRAVAIVCSSGLIAAIVPMVSLDYILRSDLIWGSTMQPIGSAAVMVALGWYIGRGRTLAELGKSSTVVRRLWFAWIRYVVPVGVVVILVLGLRDVFETFF